MPLYEYKCTQCKRHTEKIQKFSDVEITKCPHCGGLLERVVTAPAIAFKGGGWFADGYGNAKPAASANEDKTESGSSGNSMSAATDAPAKDSTASSAPTESTSPAAATAPASPSSSSEKSSSE